MSLFIDGRVMHAVISYSSFKMGYIVAMLLARRASCQDAVSLLGVGAAVVDVGVREASGPHHHTTECAVAGVLANKGAESAGVEVVLGAAGSTSGTIGRCGHTDENLGISRRSVGDVRLPVVKVDVAIRGASCV